MPASHPSSVSISLSLLPDLGSFSPTPLFVTVEFLPPSGLIPLLFLCFHFPLSLFFLLPPPLYVSSYIPPLKHCRRVCGNFYLPYIPSAFFSLAAFIENKNSIRDARTPQPGEIFFNTMRYRSSETVHRLGYFQSTACKD